jgi:tetratricopeptide (TPR) repeat protein
MNGILEHEIRIKISHLYHYLLGTALIMGCISQSSTIQKGDQLFNESRYQEAFVEYDKASGQNPDNAVIWIKRGITLDKLQRYPEALQSLSMGAQLDPSLLICDNRSGLCSYRISENKRFYSGIKKIKIHNTTPLDSSIYYCSGEACLLDLDAIKTRCQGAVSYYAEISGKDINKGVAFLCSYTDINGKCS